MEDADIDVEIAFTKRSMSKPNLPKPLTLEEKKYLLAVERGDMANVRRMLQKAHRNNHMDVDCVDSLGRGALTLAIDGENLEMVELLIIMSVKTKDGLLHAINAEFVEAVELLLEHEELIHKDGDPYSWETVDFSTAAFTPDITPLILAAHKNNYEILKILLDRGATLPMPHDIKCGCDDCIRESRQDSLRHSLSRLNEYRALASPSLIALSSSDPILTAFELSWELRNLGLAEPECKSEYLELRRQCQQFAVDLLHQSRSSQELAIILNHDPDSTPYEEGDHMKLTRLELAITYKQKKFVAHPNIQQLLAALWYEGVPGFRRKSALQKISILTRTAMLFPFYCMLYMLAPHTRSGKLMRKPFMKFLIHASSYLFFLFILILVSQRVEDHLINFFGTESMKAERLIKQRGNPPAILEYVVMLYVMGHIYEETYEIYVEGIQSYLRNLWNTIDFSRNLLYCLVFLLRVVAYIQQVNEIAKDPARAYIPRERWHAFDPQLIAEGLFAAANIFSALKLVHLFSINPHLGPLQISLGRMVIDIVKFFFIYTLVLFAFACGLNQLLWYFSDLERKKCYVLPNSEPDWENQSDACTKWRSFANVFESSQSLFWASFGMVDLGSFELTGIKTYTRFWGLLMFGCYSVINVIVLLNLLIAMMSNSYAMIDEHSDTEWKFARTKLWMSYFEEGNTLPPPFNIFPTIKTFLKTFRLRAKDKLGRMSTKKRQKEEKERDYRYTTVMRALVWRYISSMHKKCEEDMVTEDDINEVKTDISAFRYDLLEVLNKNGMDISSIEKRDKAVLGKKMKVWERQLMKDFKVAPVVTAEEADQLIYEPPPENEDALSKFRRVAKLAVLNSNLNKWSQVITGACLASQIGHCSTKDSVKKQQNLMKAMQEAKRYISRSPLPASRSSTPIELPDTTGQSIMEILKEIKDPNEPQKETLKVSFTPTPLQPNVLINQNPSISLSPPSPAPVRQNATASDTQVELEGTKPPDEVGDFITLDSCPQSPELKATDNSEQSQEMGKATDRESQGSGQSKEEPKREIDKTKDGESQGTSQSKEEPTREIDKTKDGESEGSGQSREGDVTTDGKEIQFEPKVGDGMTSKTDVEQTEVVPKQDIQTKDDTSGLEQSPSDLVKEGSTGKTEPDQIKPEKLDKLEESIEASDKTKENKDKSDEMSSTTSQTIKSCKGPAPAIPGKKSIDDDLPKSSSLQVEDPNKAESSAKSPMAARNITRVGDSNVRRQPKTGWL